MMGVEAPETCWATQKRQVINLWNGCIWLVNLFELYDDPSRSQWPRGLKRRSAVARLLRSYTPLLSPIGATCPATLILLDFITRTILSEKHLYYYHYYLPVILIYHQQVTICQSAMTLIFCDIESWDIWSINPLNPELNPICYLLALLAHHFLHVSRIRVKSLNIRLLMSYI